MRHEDRPTTRHLVWLACGALLAGGCATRPHTSGTLDEARAIYREAAASPSVMQFAPAELETSRVALARAQKADDLAEMNHQAYIAAQHARIALQVAVQRNSEQQIESLSARRRQLQSAAGDRRLSIAEGELAALEARRTDHGYVVTLGDVLFRPGSARLLPSADEGLFRLADYLNRHPSTQVLVEGHADSTGSAESNELLSEHRALSVKTALEDAGIDPGRVVARGRGEDEPIADNDDATGRAINRRVEVLLH